MFKIIIALLCIFCTVYILHHSKKEELKCDIRKTNEIDKINYSIKLKHGILNIQADKCIFTTTKNIILENVNAVYPKKNILVMAKKCEYNIKTNQILLSENVNIKINDIEITTKSAKIDVKKKEIINETNFTYKNKKFTFSGHGFCMNQDGEIKFYNIVASSNK